MAKKAKTAKAAKAAKAAPKHQPLPGMEGVRHTKLDRLCEGIAENREQTNQLRGEEADMLRQALDVMRDAKVHTYRFAGVELARVPGEEKLRVRTSKEAATAEVEGA